MQDLTDTLERLLAFTWTGEGGREGGRLAGFTTDFAAFLIPDRILGFRIAPPVVGRILNLTALRRVTSEKLNRTYLKDGMLLFSQSSYWPL